MPRSGSISMSTPPFAGATRRLVLINLAVFFGLAVLSWLAPGTEQLLLRHLMLEPLAVARGEVWQLLTYSFVQEGVLAILFGMLTLWFTGALLEGARGAQWVVELYLTSAIGGALLATAASFTHVLYLRPELGAVGAWSGIFGLMIAIAVLFGDQEFLLFFVLRMKARYLVALYILLELAMLLKQMDTFGALLQLAGALCGYLYVRFAPRRGLAFGLSEQYFAFRNEYYRRKRRRAARKFEVYMRKQNRVVHFDDEGRYIAPEDAEKHNGGHGPKDPTDRRWMN
ncbi:MAG: rhomboid family intramembrane serine protease [Acidobacteriota bacterium]|nr:rhomboid family intramembrane serine protease [Acidobacteriota bacterium]